jgi:hypothetical protein
VTPFSNPRVLCTTTYLPKTIQRHFYWFSLKHQAYSKTVKIFRKFLDWAMVYGTALQRCCALVHFLRCPGPELQEMVCSLKRRLFSRKVTFLAQSACFGYFWTLVLINGIKPPLHWGLPQKLGLLQIPLLMSSCFHQWWHFYRCWSRHWWKVGFLESAAWFRYGCGVVKAVSETTNR